MSTTMVFLLLFSAARNPTPMNCLALRQALVSHAIAEINTADVNTPITFNEDIEAIKRFEQTKCKTGLKKKR